MSETVTPEARARWGVPRMSRVWLIAMRDFVGYVKTVGFWLSFLFPVIGGVLGIMFANSDIDISPPKYETILDQTGIHGDALLAFHAERTEDTRRTAIKALAATLPDDQRDTVRSVVDEQGAEAGLAELQRRGALGASGFEWPQESIIFIDPPADSLDALRPYLDGSRTVAVDGRDVSLNGAIVFRGDADAPRAQYWTRNFNNTPAERLLNSYLRELAEARYLASGGLTVDGYDAAVKGRTRVDIIDPAKARGDGTDEGDAVSIWDRAPFIAGAVLGFFLLMTIFAGSVALLTSMIEEKMNKLLEMMLASAKFSEIMLGKMLGAAMLTLASVLPYLLVGIGGVVFFLLFGNAEQVEAMREAFPPSTVVISLLYLVLGYMFYATILISLGALAQSMQDAQTLSIPMVMVMFMGILVIQFGFLAPDSGLIVAASIFPLTSPFAMMIRLATDPPLWQVLLSLGLLALSVVGVMWLCARVFRYGVLSGGGVGAIKAWFRRTVLRRAA